MKKLTLQRIAMTILFVVAATGTVWSVNSDTRGSICMRTSLRPIALTTATRYGTTVDLSGYNACQMFVSVGAWTNGTHTFTWQKSANDSSWSDCVNADFISAATTCVVDGTPDQSQVYSFAFGGSSRYIRSKTVSGSAAAGVPGTTFMVLGYPKNSTLGTANN